MQGFCIKNKWILRQVDILTPSTWITNNIDFVTISSQGNGTDFGDLTNQRWKGMWFSDLIQLVVILALGICSGI